jgi:hypothetical protein
MIVLFKYITVRAVWIPYRPIQIVPGPKDSGSHTAMWCIRLQHKLRDVSTVSGLADTSLILASCGSTTLAALLHGYSESAVVAADCRSIPADCGSPCGKYVTLPQRYASTQSDRCRLPQTNGDIEIYARKRFMTPRTTAAFWMSQNIKLGVQSGKSAQQTFRSA